MRLRDKSGESPLSHGAHSEMSFSLLVKALLATDAGRAAPPSRPALKSTICPAVTKTGEPCRNRVPLELGDPHCSTHRRARKDTA